MQEIKHDTVATNGISMHVATQGSGKPVVLCHGFPELWFSWRHQIPALADAGYQALAPDMRGYGRTDAPRDVDAYDIDTIAADLAGLLDALGEERAVFVGHDWGAQIVWHLALAHPERVEAVVGMSVAHMPRTPVPPTELFRLTHAGRFHYMAYFQEAGPADEELARDPRRMLAAFFWSGSAAGHYNRGLPDTAGFLDWVVMPDRLPDWLTEEDLDTYASEFARTGFTGALNWYRNLDRNWKLGERREGRTIDAPALFVAGKEDDALIWFSEDVMRRHILRLRPPVLIPGVGHWTQQEGPQQVNKALLDFLATL